MDKAKRNLIRSVFSGADGKNKLSYDELVQAHALRHEVSKMGDLKKLWIMGFSAIYKDLEPKAFNKNLNKAMLKNAKEEFAALTDTSISLADAMDSEHRIKTMLRASGHKAGDLSLLGSLTGSPERKLKNTMRDVAINGADKLMASISAGNNIKDSLQQLEMHVNYAVKNRSMWDGKVAEMCGHATQCQLKVADKVINKNPTLQNIKKATQMVERLEASNSCKFASRAVRKEIAETKMRIKDAALKAIDAELQKAAPSARIIRENAKILKEHKSLRKLMDAGDKALLSDAASTVKQIERATKGKPTTLMGHIDNILSAFRGPQLGAVVGNP